MTFVLRPRTGLLPRSGPGESKRVLRQRSLLRNGLSGDVRPARSRSAKLCTDGLFCRACGRNLAARLSKLRLYLNRNTMPAVGARLWLVPVKNDGWPVT